MRTVNKVILVGNIAKDPLVKESAGGKHVLFVVATNRAFTDKAGNHKSEAEFTNCIAWGPVAENCSRFLKKGKLVYVEGRLKTHAVERPDGTKSFRTEIVVLNLIFLDKRAPGEGSSAEVGGDAPEAILPDAAELSALDFSDDKF